MTQIAQIPFAAKTAKFFPGRADLSCHGAATAEVNKGGNRPNAGCNGQPNIANR